MVRSEIAVDSDDKLMSIDYLLLKDWMGAEAVISSLEEISRKVNWVVLIESVWLWIPVVQKLSITPYLQEILNAALVFKPLNKIT